LAEIEKKNDEDSKKGLWQPKVEAKKNQTVLALIKNITSKHAADAANKPALVDQGHLTNAEHKALLQK
jgi:hypothetical protein